MKVDANQTERAWDITKLCAYRDEFGYENGVFVDIQIDDGGLAVFDKSWPFWADDA